MPEDSKKNQHKVKHEAKEQRKPRQAKQHAEKSGKKKENEKNTDVPRVPAPAPSEAPKPSVEPGPEFYKNLKRETDNILKITEEANTKYKKKEIQSNWTKYEMPIESYDEIEEQENLGADYEKLISAPLAVGGHFQFKHEKTWDLNTGPSLYDKYFEINMENLATAISTVPFYERNDIEENLFTQTDMLTMNNRAVKYKRKYFNDKFYTTPEIEAIENAIESLRKNPDTPPEVEETNETESEDISLDSSKNMYTELVAKNKMELNVETKNLDVKMATLEIRTPEPLRDNSKQNELIVTRDTSHSHDVADIDDILLGTTKIAANTAKMQDLVKEVEVASSTQPATSKVAEKPTQDTQQVKPIIDSQEDLEKWLDDFLDG